MKVPRYPRLVGMAIAAGAALTSLGVPMATVGAGTDVDGGSADVVLVPGRTTTVVVEDVVGAPVERQAEFVAAAPSYRRAIASDRAHRWVEAMGLYQQALLEVTAAAQSLPPRQLERVAFKIDIERRRSRALAEDAAADLASGAAAPRGLRPPSLSPSIGAGASAARGGRLLPMERARLLRHKLMAVRAATGAAPAGLRAATLNALAHAVREGERGAATHDQASPSASEAHMLRCATLAAAGDSAAARAELARVRPDDRTDPARALSLAACQAALGYRDDALGSLAVALGRLGPSSRFLPGPSREIESANDWDTLRTDPRFIRLFR